MRTFKLFKEDIKHFMPKLLVNTTFDKFEVRNIEINSFAKFSIESNLTKNEEDIISWETMKPYVYNIIKGNKQPKSLKVVFNLSKEEMTKISENFSACFLNIIFENGEVLFTTGSSTKTFSLNKEDEILFDEIIESFLVSSQIPAVDINKL